jgi:hypothetical protein
MEPPTAWDLLHDMVAEDGSFGRAYVSLKSHEESCFGRPITVDIPLYNEWTAEDPHISSSMKSKRGNTDLRRPPYQIGNLALQMLYVPRPKGVKEEDMPKSMNGCVREMAAAERATSCEWEGFLSQQGGDCPVSFPTLCSPAYITNITSTVLAPPLLPSIKYDSHRIPRNNPPTTRQDLSSTRNQGNR